MIDMLIQISSPVFFVVFIIFSAICIMVAWFWSADDSTQYQMPSLTSLNPFEIAALRNGRKGIIHVALFNLWQRKLLTASGTGKTAQVQRNDSAAQQPEGAIEEMIYQFASQKREPADFFTDTALRTRLDRLMKPINKTLENKHIKRTDSQMKRAWRAFLMTLFLILGLGGTKLYFGLHYDRPVVFLILLLIILPIITGIILKPAQRSTGLGHRYQKRLAKHFQWMKHKDNSGIEPAFLVASFGTSALASFAAFASFEQAFSSTDRLGTASGGGDGGGGGGCGGCGGCG